MFSRLHPWHSFVQFKHFDKLNLYLKQQNCPCLRHCNAKLNCKSLQRVGRFFIWSRFVVSVAGDFVYTKFSKINIMI